MCKSFNKCHYVHSRVIKHTHLIISIQIHFQIPFTLTSTTGKVIHEEMWKLHHGSGMIRQQPFWYILEIIFWKCINKQNASVHS